MDEFPPPLSPAEAIELRGRLRGKNFAVVVVLIAVAALFYAISVVRFKVS